MLALIDYDAGNIKSVEKALAYIGEETVLTKDPNVLRSADRVILPGVGAFGDAMARLKASGLIPVIREIVEGGTPFLGICLGLQLLFEGSEESPGVLGLSLLKGQIKRIPAGADLKIPHMGWNSLRFPNPGDLFLGLPGETYVYFVHSYYLEAEDPSIVTAETDYGVRIHASVQSGNLYGCQFHPEKSGEAGLAILRNFARAGKE